MLHESWVHGRRRHRYPTPLFRAPADSDLGDGDALSFVISLVPPNSTRDRPARRPKGRLQSAVTTRTASRKQTVYILAKIEIGHMRAMINQKIRPRHCASSIASCSLSLNHLIHVAPDVTTFVSTI